MKVVRFELASFTTKAKFNIKGTDQHSAQGCVERGKDRLYRLGGGSRQKSSTTESKPLVEMETYWTHTTTNASTDDN